MSISLVGCVPRTNLLRCAKRTLHTRSMTSHPLQPVALKSQAVNFQALPPLSLYIHIPWCARKCPYCDFNSHEARGAIPEQEYVAALTRDLELALPLIWGRKVYTVFFGGGTPSLLSGESIAQIIRNVRMLLPLGIQSFNDAHLQALGRIHSADEAKRAIGNAQQHFDNLNLDLMYALPGQTLEE